METYDDVSTLVSVLPREVKESKPGLVPSEYIIPAVKDPMKDFELLHVRRATFPVYVDESRPSLVIPEPSDRVCAALIRDYVSSVSGYSAGEAEPGLFWLPGEVSKKEVAMDHQQELSRARQLQMGWFKKLVAIMDDNWGQYHMRRMVSDLDRLACKHLNLDREWNLDVQVEEALSVCKFCHTKVHPDAIVCSSCRGILNLERYKKEFVSEGGVGVGKVSAHE